MTHPTFKLSVGVWSTAVSYHGFLQAGLNTELSTSNLLNIQNILYFFFFFFFVVMEIPCQQTFNVLVYFAVLTSDFASSV